MFHIKLRTQWKKNVTVGSNKELEIQDEKSHLSADGPITSSGSQCASSPNYSHKTYNNMV